MVGTSAGVVIEFCPRSLAEIPAEGSHHSDHALLHHGHLSNCFPAGHEMEWNNLGGLVDSSLPASHGVCPRGYGKSKVQINSMLRAKDQGVYWLKISGDARLSCQEPCTGHFQLLSQPRSGAVHTNLHPVALQLQDSNFQCRPSFDIPVNVSHTELSFSDCSHFNKNQH